jgi:hypothetical protein
MVRKEAQQAYFKDKNIETVLGDLEWCFASLRALDKVIFAAGLVVQMLSELIKKEQKTNRCL